MTRAQQRQREFDRYEKKRQELHALVETEARNLSGIQIDRDAAIHEIAVIRIEMEKIGNQIESKKGKIVELDETLKNKNELLDRQIRESGIQRSKSEADIKALEFRKKTLNQEINKLQQKAGELAPKAKECERKEKILSELEAKITKAIQSLAITTEKSEKIMEKAKKIEIDANDKKKKGEEWFRTLQKYETDLDFYATRLRNWYQEKGLKLPVDYQPDNIKKQIKK